MALLAAATLAGCEAANRMATDATNDAAHAMVARVVIDRYPSADVTPVTGCVIENATAGEIRGLASDAVIGPTEATYQTVASIALRRETLGCLAAKGLPALRI